MDTRNLGENSEVRGPYPTPNLSVIAETKVEEHKEGVATNNEIKNLNDEDYLHNLIEGLMRGESRDVIQFSEFIWSKTLSEKQKMLQPYLDKYENKAPEQFPINERAVAGDLYMRVEKYDTALLFLNSAAKEGNSFAQGDLGCMFRNGKGVPPDDLQAVECYRKAADQGQALAQNNLGWMFSRGRGLLRDDQQAITWFRKSAEQGYAVAQNNLGFVLMRGQEALRDDQQAVKWFHSAATQGYSDAQYHLGLMHAEGKGVPRDRHQAAEWLYMSAVQGHMDAQYRLGMMLYEGLGGSHDDQQAVELLHMSAVQGHRDAQYRLGLIFADGLEVQQDDQQAVVWLRMSAAQNHVRAQCDLGCMFANGWGVRRDGQQAVEWLRKAAEQNDASAQNKLEEMVKQIQPLQDMDKHAAIVFHAAMAIPDNAKIRIAFNQLARERTNEFVLLAENKDWDRVHALLTPENVAIVTPKYQALKLNKAVCTERLVVDLSDITSMSAQLICIILEYADLIDLKNYFEFRDKAGKILNGLAIVKRIKQYILNTSWGKKLSWFSSLYNTNSNLIWLIDGSKKTLPNSIFNVWQVIQQSEKDGEYDKALETIVSIARKRPFASYDQDDRMVQNFFGLFDTQESIETHFKDSNFSRVVISAGSASPSGLYPQIKMAKNIMEIKNGFDRLSQFVDRCYQHVHNVNPISEDIGAADPLADIRREFKDISNAIDAESRGNPVISTLNSLYGRTTHALNKYKNVLMKLLPKSDAVEKLSLLVAFLKLSDVETGCDIQVAHIRRLLETQLLAEEIEMVEIRRAAIA